MRIKWIALCFLLGFIIVLDPSHTPAQFGQGGGKGGKGKNRDPFGQGGGSFQVPNQGGGGFPGGGNFNRRGGDFAAPAPAAPAAPMVTTYGSGGDSKSAVTFGAPGAQSPTQFGQGGNSFQFQGGGRGQGFPGGGGGFPGGGGFQGGNFQGGGFPGGGGGFQGGGPGGGRGMGDPAAMWDRMSRGQDSIDLNDPSFSWMKGMMERRGQTLPANGILTKQAFMAEAQKAMGGASGSAPGGATFVTLGSTQTPDGRTSFTFGQDGRMNMGGNGGGFTLNMGGGGGDRDRGLERLKEQDKDGDGRVSRAEADDRLKPNFDRIDRDGDGYITLEEYRAYYAAQNGGGGGNRMDMANWSGGNGDMGNWSNGNNRQDMRKDTTEQRPVAIRYGHLPKDLPEWFDTYDTNKDGQIALHEWLKAGKADGATIEEFNRYDLDGDQIITADEVLRFNRNAAEAMRIAAIENGTNRPSFAGNGNGGGRGNGMRGPGMGGMGSFGGPPGGITLPGASLDPATASSERPYGKGGERGPGGKGGERGPGGKGKGGDRNADTSTDNDSPAPGSNGPWGNGGRKGKN